MPSYFLEEVHSCRISTGYRLNVSCIYQTFWGTAFILHSNFGHAFCFHNLWRELAAGSPCDDLNMHVRLLLTRGRGWCMCTHLAPLEQTKKIADFGFKGPRSEISMLGSHGTCINMMSIYRYSIVIYLGTPKNEPKPQAPALPHLSHQSQSPRFLQLLCRVLSCQPLFVGHWEMASEKWKVTTQMIQVRLAIAS